MTAQKWIILGLAQLHLLVIGVALAEPSSMCDISETAVRDASQIRGLRIKSDVPCLSHNKEQVKQYLLSTIQSKIPADRLKREGFVYKALGMIPQEYGYEDGIIKLYLDQLGGYYDPDKDHYVMAGWMPAILQVPVAVHELTHALQDQHFNLEPMMDPKQFRSDELVAHSALVEGDATAVMMDYSRKLIGQSSLSKDENVTAIMLQNIVGTGMIAAAQGAPQSLLNMMIFPYTSGLRFAHSLLRKKGYRSIDQAFKNLPRSTEEILHPEKYPAASTEFESVPDPEDFYDATADRSIVYRDTYGEFGISVLLSMFIGDRNRCAQAAAGWGGDTVVMYEGAAGVNPSVAWRIYWDSDNDAREFFDAYVDVLSQRSHRFSGEVPGNSIGVGLNDGSTMKLVIDGKHVTLWWARAV